MSIWKNLGRTIARAIRAAARALRRLARRGKDSASAAAETAAEIAEGVYEAGLEVAHDALDLAEHVAAVPGALVGGLLGARPEQPGDVADAASAADAGPVKAAPPAPAPVPVIKLRRRDQCVHRVLDYVAGQISREEARLPASVGLWLDDMSEDDREGLLRFPAGDLDRHMTGMNPIVGIPLLPTDAEVRARFQRDGTPVDVALRELEIDALLERLVMKGGKEGRLAAGALSRSLARLGPAPVPAEAYVHEAPAMRM